MCLVSVYVCVDPVADAKGPEPFSWPREAESSDGFLDSCVCGGRPSGNPSPPCRGGTPWQSVGRGLDIQGASCVGLVVARPLY